MSLVGTVWDALNGSGQIVIVGQPCCRSHSTAWVLARSGVGDRHITTDTLDRDYLSHVGVRL